jgi:hypothetical protein
MPRVKILYPPLALYASPTVKTEKKNQNLNLHQELLAKYFCKSDISNVESILRILSSLDCTQVGTTGITV